MFLLRQAILLPTFSVSSPTFSTWIEQLPKGEVGKALAILEDEENLPCSWVITESGSLSV